MNQCLHWGLTLLALSSCVRPAPPPSDGDAASPREAEARPPAGSKATACPAAPPWTPPKGAPLVIGLVRSSMQCPAGSVALPGGRLELRAEKRLLGSDGQTTIVPPEVVEVAPFCLDRTEVPRAAFDDSVRRPTSAVDRRPAEVTVQAAEEHCSRTGGRLPTEAEWVLAAVGLTGWAFPWGDETPPDGVCWRRGATSASCEVGSSSTDRSPEGLMDLAGNAREWVRVQTPEGGVKRFGGAAADCFPSLVSAKIRLGSPANEGDIAAVRCVRPQTPKISPPTIWTRRC